MSSVEAAWRLLGESGLLEPSKIASLKTKFQADVTSGAPQDLWSWLVARKRVSAYQARVLADGSAGPFRFGGYLIYDKCAEGPLAGSFLAVHQPTAHRVRLFFYPGAQEEDAERWEQAADFARCAALVRTPFVVRLFVAERVENYRFLVCEDRPGKTLLQKLPRKGRLPWIQATQAVEQIALGLTEIHRGGLVHGQLWPAHIWVQPSGTTQILWALPHPERKSLASSYNGERQEDYLPAHPSKQPSTVRSDLFSLGAVWYRLISGRPPNLLPDSAEARSAQIRQLIQACEKYEVPEPARDLLQLLLMADVSTELKDATVASRLLRSILSSQSISDDILAPPETLEAFELALAQRNRSDQFLEQLESVTSDSSVSEDQERVAFDFRGVDSPSDSIVRHRSSATIGRRPVMPWWIPTVAVVVVSILIGWGLYAGFGSGGREAKQVASTTPEQIEAPSIETQAGDSAAAPRLNPAGLLQTLVADDARLPWESPTVGPPLDLAMVPPAADILFAIRPGQMAQHPQGELFLQSLGPRAAGLQTTWLSETGLELEQIELLTLSLHPDEQREYSPFLVVHLPSPQPKDELLLQLGNPSTVDVPGESVYQRGNWFFYFHRTAQDNLVDAIAFSSRELISQSLSRSGLAVLSSSMARLVRRSDKTRDVTLLFSPKKISSDEGQWLLSGALTKLRRPLQLFFDERVSSVMLSLHFDEGSYLEMTVDHTLDVEATELARLISEQITESRDQLVSLVERIPRHPYWDSVRMRYDNMILELVRNTRVAVERDYVIANCWLPPMALHNLVASSELVLATASDSGPGPSDIQQIPATLDELLALPRSISITSQPDLINLLSDLTTEIKDNFQLPFDFQIKISGPDLLREGITQNQRLPDIEMHDVPLSDILTRIVLQANPDKEATSAADPRCKLVWVVAEDPKSPGNKFILVTTRGAALEQNLVLSKSFQPD